MMTLVHVVGIGLDGADGLPETVRQIVQQATLLVGSDRTISYFPNHPASRLVLKDFIQAIRDIRAQLTTDDAHNCIVVLASGDPLFFGLGRLLLEELPPEQLIFHPHVSSVQLAFHRIKVPWQDARAISIHGRSMESLTVALQQGVEKIAVLTDGTNSPGAIARLLMALNLSSHYEFWVCENLGGSEERVQSLPLKDVLHKTFAPLNVVVLLRKSEPDNQPLDVDSLPLFGLSDDMFLSFSDRPGLMTKREVRLLVLGELALQPKLTIWDIGAGTGSVAIEMARLSGTSQVYAIEKTAIGSSLIEQNCRRFHVNNVVSMHGTAPDILQHLPSPHRVFIGGSGGNLTAILDICNLRLLPGGIIVFALATLEHLNVAFDWLNDRQWQYRLLQVQISRSVPVGELTRFTPLNPVTILTATRPLEE